MRHYGDITKLNGHELPIVDVITGGSPCQDLSVAGKRAGLAGKRSGLFVEQIRVVREMRERDRKDGRTDYLCRPRFMVWENVPGAFSSGSPKGADFAAVIEEIIRVAEPDAVVSVCVPDGGWTKSGCYYAEDGAWSIAWRVHDAQFWGVPQRRKRIALVADFGGLCAPEILFERKGLSRHSEPCGTARERTAGATSDCLGGTVYGIDQQGGKGNANYTIGVSPTLAGESHGTPHAISFQERAGKPGGGKGVLIQHEHTGALSTLNNQAVVSYSDEVFCLQGNCIDRADTAGCNGAGWAENVSYTLNTIDRPAIAFSQNQRDEVRDLNDVAGALAANPGMKQQTFVYENHSQDSRYNPIGDVCETVSAKYGTGGNNMPMVVEPLCVGNGQLNNMSMAEQANTLDTMHDQQAVLVSAVDCRNGRENGEINGTLQAKSNGGTSVNLQNICRVRNVVRRLTPKECERLQGMPDDWSRWGVNEKGEVYELPDSARYRLQGNGIATPFWRWMLKRISAQYERTPTLGSLFDGQASFPVLWEGINGKGTALWTSEIDKHAVAVAKYHFPSEPRREEIT